MPRPRKYSDAQMIAALKKTRGMVYLAAAAIGCEADTIYNRAKTSKGVREAMKRERGLFVDKAESKLAKAVDRGQPWAIQMALRTLGKDRGYTEKTELDVTERVRKRVEEFVDDEPIGSNGTYPPGQPRPTGVPPE